VTGESQRGRQRRFPSKLSADEVMGGFGPDSVLSAMTGTAREHGRDERHGHPADVEWRPGRGAFAPPSGKTGSASGPVGAGQGGAGQGGAGQIQSAVLDGMWC